jgi:hypothetical protein
MTTTSGHVSVAKSIDDAKLGVVLWHRQDWSFRRCSARAAAAQWSRAARCDTDGWCCYAGAIVLTFPVREPIGCALDDVSLKHSPTAAAVETWSLRA